jgi:multidrug efflux pump subunit AcrA (membrane-fusion protein)
MKRWFAGLILAVVGIGTLQMLSRPGRTSERVPIQLTPERRQLIGVTFATVERREVSKVIATTGNVEFDEQRQSYVQTRFAGWVQQVFVNQTFQYVRRGEPLFTVYSPDLTATEEEFVLLLHAQRRVASSPIEGVAKGANSLAQAAAERLVLLGIPRSEVVRLARGGKPRKALTIYSPASGYVVKRNVFPNMYVQPETRLYTITDFSTVWVYAAIFQDDIGAIRLGDRAEFAVDAYPGASFIGRVDYVWPEMDTATRTAKVRISLSNRGGELKPGMYGRITLQVKLGEHTVIPASGVLRTGTHNIVFIDRGDGYLLPRDVELGPRVGENVVVLRGLLPGQRIVSSANFLVDSESQLQAAIGSFVPPPPGVMASSIRPAARTSAILELLTIPNPPVRGKNQVRATIRDQKGHAINGATVAVTFYMPAMPAMGMSAMREQVNLTDQGNGVYEGELTLESGGTWQVTAVATKEGRTLAKKQFNLSVLGGM